jgi:hypothetical protein
MPNQPLANRHDGQVSPGGHYGAQGGERGYEMARGAASGYGDGTRRDGVVGVKEEDGWSGDEEEGFDEDGLE